ncbi:non-specific lipid transfer protein-like 1 [Brachypodium distachyon]|uniref:Nonspecific lipid-transfer protein n=1 Tax=Brachypodium distachyon TaxID=15368 RepID=C3SA92_BRADI|nr:non-specific lipid transfer protein-like 1 [Brachypodium distachyon]ACF22726.1 nonspecific lipid-transfer protein [Brachypodium distachyon]KQK21473.1 hypothetical protein BRADI_1g60970v3 [Brachypodium distachyon]|eukprot:XP_003557807.1 non-specific lipid transfer protein-like 1 [Brachypodium distachyon]
MALAGAATILLLVLALAAAASAATPAPAPAVDCQEAFLALSDCLDYVQPGSSTARPGKTCCGEVKTAVSNPGIVDCLCAAIASKQVQLPVNMTRVLALPAACGGSNAVFSKCHVMPGGAPTEAPAPSPSAGGPSSSGGATGSPPKAAATRSPVMATLLVATVAAPLLAFYYL